MITPLGANSKHVLDFLERMNVRRDKLTEGCLRRDRLDLAGHPGTKCLLLKAPRGFGKSVQIAEGARAATDRGEHSVYLDLSSFWSEGLSEAALIASAIIAVLSPSNLSDIDTGRCKEVIALRLLKSCENPVAIFLDSVTGSTTTQRFLKTIILETPESVRLIVGERLPGTLTTLLVLSHVVPIGPRELSFTFDETCSILPRETGQVKKIFSLTDGWPYLCALAGKLNAACESIVHLAEVRTYFETDVLADIPQSLRDFLINASWLEEITAEASDYVFKVENSGRKLEELASRHGLLAFRTHRPEHFEMNRALQEYLRNRFIDTYGSRRQYFLKRIALWHWRRKEYRLVVDVALRAHDHSWAQRLTDQALLDLALRQGEIEALATWFTGIPRAKLFQMPSLAIAYAWVLYFSQRAEEAQNLLDDLNALQGSNPTGPQDPSGWGALVRAIGLATHDELQESEESCTAWIETYGAVNPVGQAAAQTCRAFIAASDRQFDILSENIASAAVISGATHHRYAFGWLAAAEVQAKMFIGEVYGARSKIQSFKEDENVAYARTPFVKGMLAALELQIVAEEESIAPDEDTMQAALNFALEYGVTDIVWNTARSAAEIYIRQGDKSRAFLLLERCRLLAKDRGLKRLDILVRLGIEVFAMGTRTNPPRVAERLSFDDHPFLPNQNRAVQAESALLEASRFLRDGKLGLAERQARKALSNFAAVRDQRGEIRAQYTLATTLYLMGEGKQARKRIADANLKAQQLGAFRTLINRRHFLRVICPETKALLDQPELQVAMVEKPSRNVQANERFVATGSAPISQKQVAVLQHAALGLSNKEIATRLHVTEDAVKWHFRKILRGLKANNRTEAVSIARSMGLI